MLGRTQPSCPVPLLVCSIVLVVLALSQLHVRWQKNSPTHHHLPHRPKVDNTFRNPEETVPMKEEEMLLNNQVKSDLEEIDYFIGPDQTTNDLEETDYFIRLDKTTSDLEETEYIAKTDQADSSPTDFWNMSYDERSKVCIQVIIRLVGLSLECAL